MTAMSKFDRLISELCPDGVEYASLGEVCVATSNISWARNGKSYQYIDLTSVDRDTHKIDKTETISTSNAPSRAQKIVATDDIIYGTTRPTLKRYCFIPPEYDGQICSTGYCVLRANSEFALPRYIYHVIGTSSFDDYAEANQRGSAYPAISDGVLKQFIFPLPPLPIQRELICILDNFTELTTELAAELAFELIARKNQYEYYRNELLTFGGDVPKVPLGEIGELVRGNGLQKKDFVEQGVGCIHYGEIYTYYGTFAKHTKSFITPELARTLRTVNKGDLIITNTSENVEDVCKTVAWLGDENIVTGGHATIFKHNQNAKFIAYYTQTAMFFAEKIKYAGGTKVIDVSANNMAKIRIPIPSLDEQARIVSVLDRFNTLTIDLINSLPTEIEARRKQYEYYRDNMLTFKEIP